MSDSQNERHVIPNCSTGSGEMTVGALCSIASSPERYGSHVPSSVPRDQAYCWTERWQEGERAALRELARGEGVLFHSHEDAIRWLMSDD